MGNKSLRDFRIAAGKTQRQVAREIDVTERNYQYYEHGHRKPTVTTAIRLARALNTTVEELYEDNGRNQSSMK